MDIKLLKRLPFFAALMLLFVAFTACEDDDEGVITTPEQTINDLIVADDDFTILAEALESSGLQSELEQEDADLTILAPTDAAFIAAGITNLDRFTADELQSILEYHLIDNSTYYSDLEEGPVSTMNGDLYVSFAGNRFFLNGDAEFLQIDFDATNGVVHVIDEVLMPPSDDVTGIVTAQSDLSMLEAAIEKAGLTETLMAEGPYTIFAPTNAAFEEYFAANEINSIDELTAEDLANILRYHVVPARTFTVDLEAGAQNTLAEQDFRVIFANNIVLSDNNPNNDNALIVEANEVGTNGVVHRIDRVLLPA